MSAKLLMMTPLIPAGADLAKELALFTEHLGFQVANQTADMARIRRDNIELRLLQNTNREWADNTSISIGVADLDGLYAEYKNAPCRVGPLEMKFWGRREFHLIVPSGVCFQFYELVE